jgi:hypothetical protein
MASARQIGGDWLAGYSLSKISLTTPVALRYSRFHRGRISRLNTAVSQIV